MNNLKDNSKYKDLKRLQMNRILDNSNCKTFVKYFLLRSYHKDDVESCMTEMRLVLE